jgi:hypothetical protein
MMKQGPASMIIIGMLIVLDALFRKSGREKNFITRLFVYLAIASIAVFPTAALAKNPNSSRPAQDGSMVPLNCGDFKYNQDGSWSLLHPVTINGVTMNGSNSRFTEGVVLGGVISLRHSTGNAAERTGT